MCTALGCAGARHPANPSEIPVMVLGKLPSPRSSADKSPRRKVHRVGVLVAVLALTACSPVETWRDWTGASKNDPDPETARNTQNLAAGEAADYPNLASVPPPPNRALTAADREKLTQSLIADRTNAKYSDERLRAGFPAVAAAPPPPPPPVPEVIDAAPGKPGESAASPPAPAPAPAPASGEAVAAPAPTSGQVRKSGEPPEPGPMESSLEMPKVRSTPNPQQVQAAPPPPYPVPASTAANAPPVTPRLQSPPAAAPLPAVLDSTAYQAAPPPVLAPLAGSGRGVQKAPAPTASPVAEIRFAGASTSLSAEDRETISRIVPLYQQNPGKIRIIGYANAGSGAAEQLNSFRAALDRAQAVAAALTQAGVPSDRIAVEAAPSGSNIAENRAEVLLEH
jgi:outer membrane protein OmpA-like peptidoglycan-associated protein